MVTINDEEFGNVELKLSPTTISLKRGTKYLLDSFGDKRDSYDDIIRTLVKENKRFKSQIENMKPANQENLNKLFISSLSRKTSSQVFPGKEIFFSFNVPNKSLTYFRFDINYEKISIGMKMRGQSAYADSLTMTKDYLLIYEKLIKKYVDPLFRIDKRRLLDLRWWKQKISALGLSEDSYRSDIEEKLISFGVIL
ncbi:MAG: hypothetical protein KKF46_06720 [Nanoarchaeota archaeon]|nr:hypothetical protein [Nanoarchaeota archaeon]MBU1322023.1 hypothetical protein [Nanoarchaeota archaeon]MBU1598108.1 hypothetical protein [Nanoarchaeota archaeon]MBU2441763.1 hypothetical protein [Nanoarchaeota archaeon]